jgi:hypothetical protein
MICRQSLFNDPPFAKIVVKVHCYVTLRSVSSVHSSQNVCLLFDVKFLFSGLGVFATSVLIFLYKHNRSLQVAVQGPEGPTPYACNLSISSYLLIIFGYPLYIVLFVTLLSVFYFIFLLAFFSYFEQKLLGRTNRLLSCNTSPTAQKTTRPTLLLLHLQSLPR